MRQLSGYLLSEAADTDLEDIFEYTKNEYGLQQAISYLERFESIFNELVANPQLGKTRNEIKEGLRSFPQAAHIIFYKILANRIRVVRVLHGSRDLPRFFEE